MAGKKNTPRRGVSPTEVTALIEEAIVDAYGDSEQIVGFYTMLENELATPFTAKLLGVDVIVERVDLTEEEEIVAVCARDRSRQRIRMVDLPLPEPRPEGWKWIEAYRQWARRGRR
jgi:hypothetical protein